MDEIILQLTHDNNLFEEQWPETYDNIRQSTVPNDAKLVLNALVEYIVAEPTDPSPIDSKYCLITEVVAQLRANEIHIDINYLIKNFLRVLHSSRTDQWYEHFLETIYQEFQIGEQLCTLPLKTNLIEQILQSLEKKTFIFNAEEEESSQKWESLLTQYIFSDNMASDNILNKEHVLTTIQTRFQDFYKHAVVQSYQSALWLKIATILNESSPEIFNKDNITQSEINLSNESSTVHYIDLLENNNELLQKTFPQLLNKIEDLIVKNQYGDAHLLISKLIKPNLTTIDLEGFLHLLTRLCSIVQNRDLFCSEILTYLIPDIEYLQLKKTFAIIVFDLSLAVLKLYVIDAPDLSYRLLRKKDFYPWKDLSEKIVDLIKTCISYETIIDNDTFSPLNQLENIIETIGEKIKVYPVVSKQLHTIVIDAILRWTNNEFNGCKHVYRMGKVLFNFIDLQQINEDICLKFIDTLQKRILCEDEEIIKNKQFIFLEMPKYLGIFIEHLKRLSRNVHEKLALLLSSLIDRPLRDENQMITFEYVVIATVLMKTALTIYDENDGRVYESFLNQMYNQAKNENDNDWYEWWVGFWLIIALKLPNLACDHIDQFFEYTLTTKQMAFVGLLLTLCPQHSELFYPHFDDLINLLLMDNGQYLSVLIGLYMVLVKQRPELISSKHIDKIFSSIETIPFEQNINVLIHTLNYVAESRPSLFDNYFSKLMNLVIEKQDILIFECVRKYILASIIIQYNETKINEYLNLLIDLIKTHHCSNDLQKEILYTCLLIGIKYKQILIKRRDDFITLDANLLINYIDNKITDSEVDQATIKRAQQDIEHIEQAVNKIRIPETLTNHVPSWGREISKLLNRRSTNDWRLLAKHLGYSSSEIKHWSMQIDPSKSLLNEWFLTHKTDEVISSLLKVLTEINRQDVEQIIRQSLVTTGQSIPDNRSMNLKRIPPIFLSFHSSQQSFVNQLNDNLRQAGYSCQIYDETNEMNIYGAKLIICCFNQMYTQSEKCSTNFQMILNLKKPFVLLSIDDKINSIFDKYNYIQYANENHFVELLYHIRYYVSPDPDLITDKYRHWFVPRIENLIFLKIFNENLNNLPLVVTHHPQIILSYQWDCLKDILNLYKQLTELGYRMWIDLFQMAGGDSLFDKYNHVIHQSLCVIVCITPKYMKSIICQQQLSLAKDLNKSIVPLILEQTDPWPPNGLEFSSFAGKNYIDFQGANKWSGKSFEMLLAQLKKLVPDVYTDKPRHLLDMQRPISASQNMNHQSKRRASLPIIPQSRACSLM